MPDVIVIGGGHAGVEAAAAAARRSASVTLVTFDARNLGTMSCNPSIGGLGKGHIVREIDAFDGVMARAADRAAIHYRLLNRSKGAAVQGPRIQADRKQYAIAVQEMVASYPAIRIIEGEVQELLIDRDRVIGVRLADGSEIHARSVVLATGTFLGARMFRGSDHDEGGRLGERPAKPLAAQLRALGLPMHRLKTGTPPRLDGRTIDWARLIEQPSDHEFWTFSPVTRHRILPQLACAATRTTAATHHIVRAASARSPSFSGAIEGAGPRYCPSIEDKVNRFADRDSHHVFLEPEALDDATVYPNGVSTSIDSDAQRAMIATIAGLEQARITAFGYAVEYDHLDPRSLTATLECRALQGLFCAGQINGTTGYEEAAGQGLIAGLNAAAYSSGLPPVVLDRASSYLGVMIDDLVLQGVTEPYRMLTARAEFRLSLRADNAEARLGPIAQAAGCVRPERLVHQQGRERQRKLLRDRLSVERSASEVVAQGGRVSLDGTRQTAWDWLRSDGVGVDQVAPEATADLDTTVVNEIAQDARYAPYVERQATEVSRLRSNEGVTLPPAIDYATVPGLSNEMVDRLTISRPQSLAAASRIGGVTPAALTAILLHARKIAA